MLKHFFRFVFVWLLMIGLPHTANAETLDLLSGQRVEGQIIEQNAMHVIIDVQGTPRTYYLGEIAKINDQAIEIPPPPVESKEERAERIKVMTKPTSVAAPLKKTVDGKKILPPVNKPLASHTPAAISKTPPATSPDSEKLDSLVHGIHEMIGKMGDNKTVIPTSDGGIIVVSNGKIAKYDKNLNVIKEINLKSDNATGSS